MKSKKKKILIDSDGVLNQYKGNYNKNYIPVPLNETREFLHSLSSEFNVKLFTVRKNDEVAKWLKEYNLENYIYGITNKKEVAWLYIDDRCICFDGNYNKLHEQINNFKPWYK